MATNTHAWGKSHFQGERERGEEGEILEKWVKKRGGERRCLSGTGGFVTFGVGAAAAVNISQATNTV